MSRIFARTHCAPLLLALAVLGISHAADAAVFRPFVGFGVGYGMGYGGYGYGYGGGTVAGNYMYGMSNVIRAEGEYNALTSMAAINNEEARSRYLDNKKKWQEIYRQSREARDKRVAEQFARSKHSPEVLAAAAWDLPHKLSSEVLDPVTGQITWPEVLLGSEFADQRQAIEQFLEVRAKTSHTDEAGERIRAAAAKMTETLRKNVQNIPANEYMSGRKFLDSLAYAVR